MNKKMNCSKKKNFVDFQNLMTIELCWRIIFESLNLHVKSRTKFGPDQFIRFEKQTEEQSIYIDDSN